MMRKLAKYRVKLFTLMVVCFVSFSSLLLLISGIVYYGTYSEIAYREILATKKELLEETSRKLSNYATGIQDTARFLVTSTMFHQYLSEEPVSVFEYVMKSRELYEEFQKLVTVKSDLHSIELYSDWIREYPNIESGSLHRLQDAENEGWLARMERADGSWISAHDYPHTREEDEVVSYVHKIISSRGENLGIIKINVPVHNLFQILGGGEKANPDSYYVVMDARGEYLTSRLPSGVSAHRHLDEMVAEVEGTSFDIILTDTNEPYWMLMQLISRDVLRQSGKEIRTLIIVLFAALMLLSIPLAFWLSRRLTSPIYSIVSGMRTLEKGDFDVRLQGSSIQEYLYLTTHFNRMVQRLRDLIDRLNQEHRDRREAEIQLLHAQIKPHFLYNTLDLIHWRALDYNAQEISMMAHQLSKLFRIGLSNDKWYVTVRDELVHAQCYMMIQTYRQNVEIDYQVNVESDLLDVMIPKIILQPFLENAVLHGFRHRAKDAMIRVSFEQQAADSDELLLVKIVDNGSGLPDDFDLGQSGGIGIRNVQDRIHLFCGSKYGVQVCRAASGGTEVIIRLPLIRSEEEMEKRTRSISHEYHSLSG